MNINEYVKYIRKDFIYESYTNVVRDVKEYDKITRKRMCLEVLKSFQNIEKFSSLINYKEYIALTHLIEDTNIESEIDIYENLMNRMLCHKELSKNHQYVILDEFKETIKEQLMKVDIQKLKKSSNFYQIIPGIIKSYGFLSFEHMTNCLQHYCPKNVDIVDFFLSTDYFLQFYNYSYYCYSQNIIDKRYFDYYEEFDQVYHQYDFLIKEKYFIPKKTIILIGKYGYDIYNKKMKMFYDLIEEKYSYLKNDVIEYLTLASHFQFQIDTGYFGYSLQNFLIENQLLPIMKEIVSLIPSTLFHGYNEKQFLKRYEKKLKNLSEAKLSEEDALLFYKVYFTLLEYINKKYKITNKLKRIYQQHNIKPEDVVPIRDYLFSHLNVIKDFIRKNPYHFNDEELNIVDHFRYSISDTFIIMEYDNEYAYLMGQNTNFAIKGLHSSIEELIPEQALPYFCQLNLIPFKDCIIYDGIIGGTTHIQASDNIIRTLKSEYKKNITYHLIDCNSSLN